MWLFHLLSAWSIGWAAPPLHLLSSAPRKKLIHTNTIRKVDFWIKPIVCSHLFKWFSPHLFTTLCLMENRGAKEVSCFSLQDPRTTSPLLERGPANWPSLDTWFEDEETLYLIFLWQTGKNQCWTAVLLTYLMKVSLKTPQEKYITMQMVALKNSSSSFLSLPPLS